MNEIKIDKVHIGQIKSFNCLGSTVNENTITQQEIRERIMAGNKASYANK